MMPDKRGSPTPTFVSPFVLTLLRGRYTHLLHPHSVFPYGKEMTHNNIRFPLGVSGGPTSAPV